VFHIFNPAGIALTSFLANNEIELYGSAGYHHQVEGGYPPYSHNCSILDSSMFGTIANNN
jgi:hypothetical protein